MLKVVKTKLKKNPKTTSHENIVHLQNKDIPPKKKRKKKKTTHIESFTLNVQFSHFWFTKILMRKLSVKNIVN